MMTLANMTPPKGLDADDLFEIEVLELDVDMELIAFRIEQNIENIDAIISGW